MCVSICACVPVYLMLLTLFCFNSSSDIWSLGLCLLVAALGKFPSRTHTKMDANGNKNNSDDSTDTNVNTNTNINNADNKSSDNNTNQSKNDNNSNTITSSVDLDAVLPQDKFSPQFRSFVGLW